MLKPIYLLADSQPLFEEINGSYLLKPIIDLFGEKQLNAAYIGASNGDNPAFYELFTAAMELAGVSECKMITSNYSSKEATFIENADIILLAGGDVQTGWEVMRKNELDSLIPEIYMRGGFIIGISAGAVQTGLYSRPGPYSNSGEPFETLKLIPYLVGVHEENNSWQTLKQTSALLDYQHSAIGIPKGGVLAFHPNNFIEPLKNHSYEFIYNENELIQNILIPEKQF